MDKTNIYVLRLEGGYYYVGKSDDIMQRFQQHLLGSGSAWTRMHRPVKLEKTISNVSAFEEDKITKEYMSKYGIDRVRGGSYVELELSEFHMEALKMEIWAANNCCTNCGRSGHFIKDCFARTDVYGNEITYDDSSSEEYEWMCDKCNKEFATKYSCKIHEQSCNKKVTIIKKSNRCYRCGNIGHYSPDCYATWHVDSYRLI